MSHKLRWLSLSRWEVMLSIVASIATLLVILVQQGVFSRLFSLDHRLVASRAYRASVAGGALPYYDFEFDGPPLKMRTPGVDFRFKLDDPGSSTTKIGVETFNGAQYAPRFPGRLPWELEPGHFTSSSGVYSVEQGQDIPCFTSENKPCTFKIRLNSSDGMIVSFHLYE